MSTAIALTHINAWLTSPRKSLRQVTLMGDDVGGRLRLSILDHTPVSSGSTLGDAFWHSTRLANSPNRSAMSVIGWPSTTTRRGWASSSPAVLVAHVAARTTSLRVGSGGVMFSHYAPLSVVEQFGLLEQRHPRSD